MNILLTHTFKRSVKKLHQPQKNIVEEVIQQLSQEPLKGNLKIGDLVGIRVFKFFIHHQQMLLAYVYEEPMQTITLLMLAPHENFYQNLKNLQK